MQKLRQRSSDPKIVARALVGLVFNVVSTQAGSRLIRRSAPLRVIVAPQCPRIAPAIAPGWVSSR
jgi:hypothetical protein